MYINDKGSQVVHVYQIILFLVKRTHIPFHMYSWRQHCITDVTDHCNAAMARIITFLLARNCRQQNIIVVFACLVLSRGNQIFPWKNWQHHWQMHCYTLTGLSVEQIIACYNKIWFFPPQVTIWRESLESWSIFGRLYNNHTNFYLK